MDWGKVAKDLLVISEWPWDVVPKPNYPDEPMIRDKRRWVVAGVSGADENASFIAAAPRLLAEALVEAVREQARFMTALAPGNRPDVAGALNHMGITGSDYAEIKRRLG